MYCLGLLLHPVPTQDSTTNRFDEATSSDVFRAIADEYRRGLLVALLEHDVQDVGDPSLPAHVTLDGERPAPSRIRITNVHLPRLERAEFVEWNRDANVVRRGPRFEEVRPLLEWLYDYDESPGRPPDGRARTEVLCERHKQLRDHIRAVSHDLRGLFNVADGYVVLALDTGDLSHLDTTRQSIARAEELLDQFETLATSGEPRVEPGPVDFRDVAETAWAVAGTEDAELTVTANETLTADRGQLQQLLENLFRNAVEHAGPGVNVGVGPMESGGFYVEDDGPGIPRAERSRVFEMGVSGDATGTGVGLTICRQVAEVHGWRIDVLDGSTGGARFEVSVERR